MAFGTDKNRLLLASGKAYIGTPGWVTPELIGTNNVRFNTYFTGDRLGSVKRGSQIIDLAAEYVEAVVDTPGKLFRKDPTRLMFKFTGDIYEANTDLLAVINNREVQAAYSITTPSVENWDITFIGSDIQPITERGILIQTRDVSGKNFEVAMYAAISTPEAWQLNMSGDDYVLTNVNFEATPHANFTTLAQDRRNYGYVARQNS